MVGRLPAPGDPENCYNCAVLSYDFWKLLFKGNRDVVGRTINIDGQDKVIVGVLPANFRLPSSSVAVWTVLSQATPRFSNFMSHIGAVARMKNGVQTPQLQRDLIDQSEDAGYRFSSAPMRASSVRELFRRTLLAYLGFLLLALACAVGIAWMLRRDSGFAQPPLSLRERMRWWGFFLLKSAALIAAAYFGSWLVIHRLSVALIGSIDPMADEIAIWTFLPLAVAALSWSILDQQKRCRICLRRLVMPIDIGRPGSVLLNWAGTEMVCSEGHGTLYLPESESNSLERDRWNNLDQSWESLFRAG